MKLCVVSPNACQHSGKRLADLLGVEYYNLSQVNPVLRDKRVFNYGSSEVPRCAAIINQPQSVARCIDKLATFKVLKAANLPHPGFATRRADVPKEWEHVVIRTTLTGKGNEGMSIVENNGDLPYGKLYTQYFYHSQEYRIVVFMGKVIVRYRKDDDGKGNWEFTRMLKRGFEQVDQDCIKAAQALGIDYVGFDVVENEDDGTFVILEANSGPILKEEMGKSIKKYFKEKG